MVICLSCLFAARAVLRRKEKEILWDHQEVAWHVIVVMQSKRQKKKKKKKKEILTKPSPILFSDVVLT